MAVTDVKFSNFADGGDLTFDDIVVGLRGGVNTRFSYQGTPVGTYLPLAGGTMSGTIDMDNNSITGVPTPTLPSDAVPFSSLTAYGTPSPLTKVDDTNVTLTLGGTPATALLQSTSITAGWSGQLAVSRGGTGNSTFTAYSLICAGTTATGSFQNVLGVGSLNQVLVSQGAGALPVWSSVPGVVPAALTRVDDTNVTLTLGGSPSTALLQSTSITAGWTGQLSATRGGTGIGTYITGDILYSSATDTLSKLAGNTTTAKQFLSQTGDGVNSAAPVWAAVTGGDVTGAALTKTDDTNVTLTLGGTPATSLLRATSLTLGWTGQLGLTRGGTNANLTASNGGIVYSTATEMAILAGTATAGQILRSGASAAPSWSTATYPSTAGTAGNVLTSDGTNFVSSPPAATTGFESSLLLMGG